MYGETMILLDKEKPRKFIATRPTPEEKLEENFQVEGVWYRLEI